MASRHFSFKTGKVGAGAKHAEYVAGQGKYSERDDVRHLSDRNMPEWAVDGRDFFAAADQLERANGRVYSEIEFAIPRECADPVAYAEQYAAQLMGDRHPYRLAVHDKAAADGGRNIHGHLMFSERRLDGIARTREQFFKRANSKHPERGGCAKDRLWNDREHIQRLRRGYEAHATAHGIALDLRSNLAQGLAEPEPKIGPQRKRSAPDLNREERAASVKRLRGIRAEAAQVRAELTTTEKELRNESIKQRRARHREFNRRTGIAQVHDLRGIDDLPVGHHPQRVLPGDERRDLAERPAQQNPDRVHELDAARAGERLTGSTPEQLAQAIRALAAASLAERQQAEQAQRRTAIRATADQERRSREVRRGAWQAKHYSAPALSPRRAAAPEPGKPVIWTTGKGVPLVVDYGNRIKATGTAEKAAGKAAALVQVAKTKGWTTIAVTGPEAFRRAVANEALRQGVALADSGLRAYAEAERQRQAQEAAQRAAEAERIQRSLAARTSLSKQVPPPPAAQQRQAAAQPQPDLMDREAQEQRARERAVYEEAKLAKARRDAYRAGLPLSEFLARQKGQEAPPPPTTPEPTLPPDQGKTKQREVQQISKPRSKGYGLGD